MKKDILVLLIAIAFAPVFFSCENNDKDIVTIESDIQYGAIEKEYVLIRDVTTLQQSTDGISLHIDSILNGFIDAEFISTGYKSFDLNTDEIADIAFEIIDLREFNQDALPASFDHLAARAVALNLQLLDNSTFGYADALEKGALINSEGNWVNQTVVLGTFLNAGQFQGQGERYLAFRFTGEGGFQYGWIRLECSQHNDTLKIYDFAYKNNTEPEILAGQIE